MVPVPIDIVLAGSGGYGRMYLDALLDNPDPERFRLAGVVDPAPERCGRRAELEAAGIPLYRRLEDYYGTREGGLPGPRQSAGSGHGSGGIPDRHGSPPGSAFRPGRPDGTGRRGRPNGTGRPDGTGRPGRCGLAVISSPIPFHAPQALLALARGDHVLVEKPAAATVQDVDAMIRGRDRAGRIVAVGYQWSFSVSITALKRDIRAGLFGAPRLLKSLCLWPRDEAYYGRNDWAGRARDGAGRWVLDGPANNAMAHDLHNMLFLLGAEADTSARPIAVTAELYRANPIENCDTAALRVFTAGGAELLFLGSHAVPESRGPVFSFEFERAVVEYPGHPAPIRARLHDGTKKEYPSPAGDDQDRKLRTVIAAVAGGGGPEGTHRDDAGTLPESGGPAARPGGCATAAPRPGRPTPRPGGGAGTPRVPCGLEAARAQVLAVNGAHDSTPAPCDFPGAAVRVTGPPGRRLRYVTGLDEILAECFDRGLLPSEAGADWAAAGRKVDLRGYRRFPGG